ncbi:MAG: hypothetical protein E7000_02100 [Coriobacteriaceae bacterium]|nr:hypothetical protein [Coriobacteriaceae bacterium]
MNTREGEQAGRSNGRVAAACPDDVPILGIRVFGGFDLWLGDVPVDPAVTRQRKLQVLMGILAVNHGQELFSDHVADSIWPRSPLEKKRHSFYNLWYVTTRAVYEGKREDNPYFERRHHTCRLIDAHVHTDVEDVELACKQLARHDLTPAQAIEAYRFLQDAYRGDLLPGETENAIILRARMEWRERVTGALSAAAHQMMEHGEDRTALWMATAASRISGTREDVARLRMALFAKMGMKAYAVRAYDELDAVLREQVGFGPSPQSVQLMEQVIESGPSHPSCASPRRRRHPRRTAGMRSTGYGRPLAGEVPAAADFLAGPM